MSMAIEMLGIFPNLGKLFFLNCIGVKRMVIGVACQVLERPKNSILVNLVNPDIFQ
jgi:hypothetical protein